MAVLWDVEVIRYTHRLIMQTRYAVFQLFRIYKLRDVDGTQVPVFSTVHTVLQCGHYLCAPMLV